MPSFLFSVNNTAEPVANINAIVISSDGNSGILGVAVGVGVGFDVRLLEGEELGTGEVGASTMNVPKFATVSPSTKSAYTLIV